MQAHSNPITIHRVWRPFTRLILLAVIALASGCSPQPASGLILIDNVVTPTPTFPAPTPFPTRPAYQPGELVDYTAQAGDTLPVLAVRFNTTVEKIFAANPIIPRDATTMPPGMPMKIPIYYKPLWGSPYQIIPDSLFINGPAQIGFDTQAFISGYPGWLNGYTEFAAGELRTTAQIIDRVALEYSVSPRLLLALLEYQAGGLTVVTQPADRVDYPLDYPDYAHKGLYAQLNWAANLLNNGYYAYRMGELESFEHFGGRLERPDPWQNAATVSLQYYFSRLFPYEMNQYAIGPDGIAKTYTALFGDPWVTPPHIPGSLVQPAFDFPFRNGETWVYTGGPHTGWGLGAPLAAIDFAPPLVAGGCTETDEYATAVAAGTIVRTGEASAVLDLDGDGDERTGWVVFYLHLSESGKVASGAVLQAGDPMGHPSCEGGRATGTHVHIARKYNGEWMPAFGTLSFNLQGWVTTKGSEPYIGQLLRFDQSVTASTKSVSASHITAGAP